MTTLDCLTCRTHTTHSNLDDALAAAGGHQCLGLPYPLRVAATAAAPAQPATATAVTTASVPTPVLVATPHDVSHTAPAPVTFETVASPSSGDTKPLTWLSVFEEVEFQSACSSDWPTIEAAVGMTREAIVRAYRMNDAVLPPYLRNAS